MLQTINNVGAHILIFGEMAYTILRDNAREWRIKMNTKILSAFFVFFSFCCNAMDDVYVSPTEEQSTQLGQQLEDRKINRLTTITKQIEDARTDNIAPLVTTAVTALRDVLGFLTLVSSQSAELDELDDYTLKILCTKSSNCIERFAALYKRLKKQASFRENVALMNKIDLLLQMQ